MEQRVCRSSTLARLEIEIREWPFKISFEDLFDFLSEIEFRNVVFVFLIHHQGIINHEFLGILLLVDNLFLIAIMVNIINKLARYGLEFSLQRFLADGVGVGHLPRASVLDC